MTARLGRCIASGLISVVLPAAASVVPSPAAVPIKSTSNGSVKVIEPAGGVFGSRSFWRADIRSAPVALNSPAMAASLAHEVATNYGGVAAFNVDSYGMSWYTVPATTKTVRVAWTNCQKFDWTPKRLYGKHGAFVHVPIPSDAVPTKGSDHELSIYRRSTDTLWDFWEARRTASGWSACWGGRLNHVSRSRGFFHHGMGMSATGIASEGGAVSINDAKSGVIRHAIALAIPAPAPWNDFSWPAQRSDGYNASLAAIPEGSRLRLDPHLNVNRLGLTRIGRMVARAAQTYGFVVTDQSPAVSIAAESPAAYERVTGKDPWTAIEHGVPPDRILRHFPWSHLQILPKNYGRPKK